MPVRIYEIAKRLGITSKEVLAKAQELGLKATTAASSLDKINAEYLEELIRKECGLEAAPPQAEQEVAESSVEERPIEERPIEEEPPTEVEEPASPVAELQAEATSAAPSIEAPLSPTAEDMTPVVEPAKKEAEPAVLPTQQESEVPTVSEPAAQLEEAASQEPIVEPTRSEQQSPQISEPPPVEPSEEVVAPDWAEAKSAEPAETVAQQGEVEQVDTEQTPTESTEVEEKLPEELEEEEEEEEHPRVQKVGFIDVSKYLKTAPRREFDRRGKKKEKSKPKGKAAKAKGPGPKPGKEASAHPSAPAKKARPFIPTKPQLPPMPPPETLTEGEVVMRPPIIVRDLAEALGKKPFQIIADLMEWGFFFTVNQAIDDPEIARRLCAKYKKRFRLERRGEKGQSPAALAARRPLLLDEEDRPQDLKPRPPVVTIMGHVDHGKTTLLDAIRKSNIVATEAGQITQHIGAYTITIPHPEKKNQTAQITFIDTPGHEAFTAMRARGANVTDIVVLVVAADDGVMPQTLEALEHARAAGVPIIVAVNKIDAPGANPMKVRQQLQSHGLTPDEWGGDTIFVDISALKRQNIDTLLEMILLQAELLDLKANPKRRAKGNVIESAVEKAGPTATLLVRNGTLRVGDAIVCGTFYGKARALIDDWGNRVKEAGPGIAVKVLGLNGAPEPGLEFVVVEDEKTAREIAEQRAEEEEAKKSQAGVHRPQGVADLLRVVEEESKKVLRLVIKGDTQGTAEAVAQSIRKIESEEVRLDIVSVGVGSVSESDVLLASASKAVIIGFSVKVDSAAATLAKQEGVQIKLYSVIYHLLDDVKRAMEALIEPEYQEVIHGEAEVRKVFQLSRAGTVAGCQVLTGRILRNGKARVIRDSQTIFDGNIASLRHLKEDVAEVRAGMECGIRLEGFTDFLEGDLIQCYTVEPVRKQ